MAYVVKRGFIRGKQACVIRIQRTVQDSPEYGYDVVQVTEIFPNEQSNNIGHIRLNDDRMHDAPTERWYAYLNVNGSYGWLYDDDIDRLFDEVIEWTTDMIHAPKGQA